MKHRTKQIIVFESHKPPILVSHLHKIHGPTDFETKQCKMFGRVPKILIFPAIFLSLFDPDAVLQEVNATNKKRYIEGMVYNGGIF